MNREWLPFCLVRSKNQEEYLSCHMHFENSIQGLFCCRHKHDIWNFCYARQIVSLALKNLLNEVYLLAYADGKEVQILSTDVSSKDIDCILSQSPDGSNNNETMVVYGSRPLRVAITRYSSRHSEPIAMLWNAKYLREYLGWGNILDEGGSFSG